MFSGSRGLDPQQLVPIWQVSELRAAGQVLPHDCAQIAVTARDRDALASADQHMLKRAHPELLLSC
jgi:hypothetical protein